MIVLRLHHLTLITALQHTHTHTHTPPPRRYQDDETVPAGSDCPTFASTVVWVDNARWEGVPFILKCGKALDERKGEIRIQFKAPPASSHMFAHSPVARNELVIRLQPEQSIYMKMNIKAPGLQTLPFASEMDLQYDKRYPGVFIPEAYVSGAGKSGERGARKGAGRREGTMGGYSWLSCCSLCVCVQRCFLHVKA